MEYYIYADESCHLQNDDIKPMVLGCAWAPQESIEKINKDIRNIKIKHGFNEFMELKWVKISKGILPLYEEIVDYFFSNSDINFRALLIEDKEILDHDLYNMTHDDFYYLMLFSLFKQLIKEGNEYKIFLDYKDSVSGPKALGLHKWLIDNYNDEATKVKHIQAIPSDENQMLQICDILMGAMSYKERGLTTNEGKLAIISKITEATGRDITQTTYNYIKKFNVLRWKPYRL